ncbi:MAG: c-type cytochrome [Alphaproteobacteria bacterium]|nr:c-type cytochrome [Alphaproteobacteria bacterium]
MQKWLTLSSLAAILAIMGPGPLSANSTATEPSPPPGSISIDLGKADFRTYCAACHGVSGNGDGTIAEFLTIAAPDLTLLTKRNAGTFPRERITEVIDGRAQVRVHGPRDMPVWGDWFSYEAASPDTDRDARALIVSARIESLVQFIETLQEK